MEKQVQSRRAPIVAIALLIPSLVYLTSYFALVRPWAGSDVCAGELYGIHYRCPVVHPYAVRVFFRPLQLIDLRFRPTVWQKPTTDPNFVDVEP
jgi:hypothetical protein